MHYVMAIVEQPETEMFATVLKTRGPQEILGKLNGIGGKIEDGEFPGAAMTREWKEETGSELDFTQCMWGTLSGKDWHMNVFYKTADHLFFMEPVNDVGEKLGWTPLSELLLFGVPNLSWMIPLCRQRVFFHCWEAT